MRIVDRYLSRELLLSFGLAALVLTFSMCIGSVVRAVDYLARGVAGEILFKVFIFILPYMLTFTIPISLLTAVLLLFSRLSTDGELTAMKASGLSMWQIAAPVLLISIALSGICLWINWALAPRSHYARAELLAGADLGNPVELLDEGRWNRDIPGLLIYIGSRSGERIRNVILHEVGRGGLQRATRAKSGTLNFEPETHELVVTLYDVRIDEPRRPGDSESARYISTDEYTERIDISAISRSGTARKKLRNYTVEELVGSLRDVRKEFPHLPPEDLEMERMALMVELNQRVTLSVSCFAFSLLGIGLGIRSRRKETSIGIGISLLVVFFYYFFIILAQSLVHRPFLRPDLIQWFPIMAAQASGFWLLWQRN